MSTAFPIYLAMTAAEFAGPGPLPQHPAWMACHFSCYGTGLSNSPRQLPKGAMLIVNDRTPVQGHDPALVAEQLSRLAQSLEVSGILLDFQRPGSEETRQIVEAVTAKLQCPVGVSEQYAAGQTCPVFLPPPPPHCPLEKYLASWEGCELWLEAALNAERITVSAEGSAFSPVPSVQIPHSFQQTELHCHYTTEVSDEHVTFTLFRTSEDLSALLQEAAQLGVTRAVGLFQELRELRLQI